MIGLSFTLVEAMLAFFDSISMIGCYESNFYYSILTDSFSLVCPETLTFDLSFSALSVSI
jgi:hypothetical protein